MNHSYLNYLYMETKKKKKGLPVDDTATTDMTAVIEPVDSTSPDDSLETTPAPTADTEEVAITTPTTVENTNDAPTPEPLPENVLTAEDSNSEPDTTEQAATTVTALPSPQEMVDRLAASQHYTDNERQAMSTFLATLLDETSKGEIGETTLQILAHAVNYERDMLQAAREGEIKGRNMKIEEYLIERKSAEEVRQLGSAAAPSRPVPPASVIGGLSAADRMSIWERGHEKRVCHH